MKPIKREYIARKISPILGLIMFSIVWSVIILWPHLFDKYRVSVDVQNHYWMVLFQNPSLFPKDPLSMTNKLVYLPLIGQSIPFFSRSVGYGLLLWFGSRFMDPIWTIKYLWVGLLPLTIVYLFLYGKSLMNHRLGVTLSIVFIFYSGASPDSLSLASGLQRAFQIPLLIGFLYYLEKKNDWLASLTVILSALMYLPLIPPMLLTYSFSILKSIGDQSRKGFSRKTSWKRFFPLGIAVIISLSLVVWGIVNPNQPIAEGFITNVTQKSSILNNPIYQSGGSSPIYLHFPFIGRAGIFESYPEAVIILVMLVSSAIVFLFNPKGKKPPIPQTLWHLFLAGAVMFSVANLSLFVFSNDLFYMPSRYLRCPLFFIGVFVLSQNSTLSLKVMTDRLKSTRLLQIYLWCIGLFGLIVLISMVVFGFTVESIGWSLLIAWGVVLTLGVLFWVSGRKSLFGPGFDQTNSSIAKKGLWGIGGILIFFVVVFYSRLVGYGTINPSQSERELYAYLKTLPEDIILAGSPEELTEIPLFAKRAVLIRDLRPGRGTPVLENFQAYYAEDPGVVAAFCKRYQVDYLLINQNDFSKEYLASRDYFYQPYNAKILSYLEDKQVFLLPAAESVFNSGPLRLIPCSGEVLKY